jgi:hypothetical protein
MPKKQPAVKFIFDFGLFDVIEYGEIAYYGAVWLVKLDMTAHHGGNPHSIIVLENWGRENASQFTTGRGELEGNFIIEPINQCFPIPDEAKRVSA